MSVPRHQCLQFVLENGGRFVLLKKEDFDKIVASAVLKGPFKETFGDGYGEPYNPWRQAFALIIWIDGAEVVIYCELKKTEEEKADPKLFTTVQDIKDVKL